MCGASGDNKRIPQRREIEYLDSLVRGVYVKRDLPAGYVFHHGSVDLDFYLAIPLQKGQLSCREIMHGQRTLRALKAAGPVMIDDVDSPYASDSTLRELIYKRGLMTRSRNAGANPPSLPEFLQADFAGFEAGLIARCRAIEGRRLFLSGATGGFGRNLLALCSELQRRGARFAVTALSRAPEAFLADNPWCRDQPWLTWVQGDARNPWPGWGRP